MPNARTEQETKRRAEMGKAGKCTVGRGDGLMPFDEIAQRYTQMNPDDPIGRATAWYAHESAMNKLREALTTDPVLKDFYAWKHPADNLTNAPSPAASATPANSRSSTGSSGGTP